MSKRKWTSFGTAIVIALLMALSLRTAQAGDVILLNDFDSSSSSWCSYWWGMSGDVPIDRFDPVAWEKMGGVGGTGYVWADDTKWGIDYPGNSILAFIKYQSWEGSPQLNLKNAVVSVYLRGEALDLKGGNLLFWILNTDKGVRHHYVAHPLTISQGSWGELQTFVLRNDESLWVNSWASNPSDIPTLDYVLGHVDSYGFSFRGMPFGQKVTGRLLMDELSITTPATPTFALTNPVDGDNFDTSSSNWHSYWWGMSGDVPIDRFSPVTWENMGGVGDTGYVWTDDTRWGIDYPDSNSILAFIRYQCWNDNPPLNLKNAVVSVYLRGEALDLKGAKLFFWILNTDKGVRYHYVAHPLTISQGSWGELQSFVLQNDESLWFNSWASNPSDIPNADYILGHVDSYGFSFRGMPFGQKVTGRLLLDELAITTPTTPTITWTNPADSAYGTALSAAQLNATASVPGTFVYTPPPGTLLNAGVNQTLSVAFTPTDATNYTGASASAHLTVTPATPTITWTNPADIVYGTALSAAQLNATASVSGTFVYTPPARTLLNVGVNQALSVAFTPADATNYTGTVAGAHLTVFPAVHAYFEANPVSGLPP